MFERIRNWRRNREQRKLLFSYWDGHKTRWADPIKVYVAMECHPVYRADIHPKGYDSGDRESERIICEMVCDVFGVKEWEEDKGGLTLVELGGLFANFLAYIQTLKKNIEPSPSSPQPTLESMSAKSNEAITKDTSDCGSMEIESVSAPQTL